MNERPVLVVGVGNELRGDDGAGIQVARRARERAERAGIDVREHKGEPTELLDVWQGRDAVVLVDTMKSGVAPGCIRRLDASSQPLPVTLRASPSTHAVTLGEAIELGRAVHRLPERVIVFAIEGRTFEAGASLSRELRLRVQALAEAAVCEAIELADLLRR